MGCAHQLLVQAANERSNTPALPRHHVPGAMPRQQLPSRHTCVGCGMPPGPPTRPPPGRGAAPLCWPGSTRDLRWFASCWLCPGKIRRSSLRQWDDGNTSNGGLTQSCASLFAHIHACTSRQASAAQSFETRHRTCRRRHTRRRCRRSGPGRLQPVGGRLRSGWCMPEPRGPAWPPSKRSWCLEF